jgi:F420-dependent oxidoreductase-like protein
MPRYAIKTPPQTGDWNSMLETWREADQIELFESAWVFDHLYPLRVHPSNPCMESWVTLSALAQATNRLRLGSMVNAMHFRHPAVTANMAASLDIVSGGRLHLGLGAGWYEEEAHAYGIDLGSMRRRMDRFDEGVEVVVSLLSNETTTFEGEYYHLTDAWCEPKGPQRPHPPIAIGGVGERRTLRTVARWAAWWDAMMVDPADWPRLNDVLLSHCAAVGRNPAEITRSAHVRWSADQSLDEVVDHAHRLFEAGVDVVVFAMGTPFAPSRVDTLATRLEAA